MNDPRRSDRREHGSLRGSVLPTVQWTFIYIVSAIRLQHLIVGTLLN